jgi:biopolymer transport protein ExbD
MKNDIYSEDEGYKFNFMPLLDAIFLLTIFFILTVTFQEEEELLPLELPTSEQTELSEIESALFVEVHKSGRYYIRNTLISEANLESTISDYILNGNKDVIIIRSEKGTDFQRILRLTDIARKLGVEKVSFAVKGE